MKAAVCVAFVTASLFATAAAAQNSCVWVNSNSTEVTCPAGNYASGFQSRTKGTHKPSVLCCPLSQAADSAPIAAFDDATWCSYNVNSTGRSANERNIHSGEQNAIYTNNSGHAIEVLISAQGNPNGPGDDPAASCSVKLFVNQSDVSLIGFSGANSRSKERGSCTISAIIPNKATYFVDTDTPKSTILYSWSELRQGANDKACN